MMDMALNEKIAEGRFREVFRVDDGRCAKILKSRMVKDYPGFQVSYPMYFYNFFKFGIPDFNRLEFANYQALMAALPQDAKQFFAEVYSVGKYSGKSISICELIRDSDGSVSQTLAEVKRVSDKSFWDAVSYLKSLFLERDLHYFGLRDTNVLVHRVNGAVLPVIIDYKRFGSRTYPFQPLLNLPGQKRKKLERLFTRIESYSG